MSLTHNSSIYRPIKNEKILLEAWIIVCIVTSMATPKEPQLVIVAKLGYYIYIVLHTITQGNITKLLFIIKINRHDMIRFFFLQFWSRIPYAKHCSSWGLKLSRYTPINIRKIPELSSKSSIIYLEGEMYNIDFIYRKPP